MGPCLGTAVCGGVLDSDPPDGKVVAEQNGVRGGPATLVAEKLHVLDRGGENFPLKIGHLMRFRACLIKEPTGETALERRTEEGAVVGHSIYVAAEPRSDVVWLDGVVD
jgi:hypothetical protein